MPDDNNLSNKPEQMGNCNMFDSQEGAITDNLQIHIQKRSPQQLEELLKEVTEFKGKLTDLKVSPALTKLLKELGEKANNDNAQTIYVKDNHGLPFYFWGPKCKALSLNEHDRAKEMEEQKRSLLNGEVKILFSGQPYDPREDRGEVQQQKEIVAYFHGSTRDGFAYTMKGLFVHAEGRIYKGGMANSKANFQGSYENRKIGYTYEGTWQEGLQNERGKETYNGCQYTGMFISGKKSGRGILEGPGFKYEGGFIENKFSGMGVLDTQNSRYEGNFINGMKHGSGLWVHKNNGQKYEGQFEDDMKNGFGCFDFDNGYRYEGNFKNDKMDGSGKILRDDKLVHMGVWANGQNLL